MAVVSNDERLGELIHSLCQVLGIADAGGILRVRSLDVGGFDVHLDYLESDVGAMYLNMFYVSGHRWPDLENLSLDARSESTDPAPSVYRHPRRQPPGGSCSNTMRSMAATGGKISSIPATKCLTD